MTGKELRVMTGKELRVMTGKELRAIKIAQDRAIESGDDETAMKMAEILAPFYERLSEIREQHPAKAYARWGVEA